MRPTIMRLLPHLLLILLVASGSVGAAKPKTVMFLCGEHEYQLKISLPEFAAEHLEPAGWDCRFVHALSDAKDSPERHVFPGLKDALAAADVLVVATRRRFPPADDLALLRKWIADGNPVLGLRTACHGFALRNPKDPIPAGHAVWNEFDREVFGVRYDGHFGKKTVTLVSPGPAATTSPLTTGLEIEAVEAFPSFLYKMRELDPNAQLLLTGTVDGQPGTRNPVAWSLEKDGGRRVFITLGARDDFKAQPWFPKMLMQTIQWLAEVDP